MDSIRVKGGNELNGRIPISGAKNAALPLMIASLLTDDTLTLENVPASGRRRSSSSASSATTASTIRSTAAARSSRKAIRAPSTFPPAHIVDTTAPYELVSKMRASFWVIGPLLARMGEAKVSLPGGCAIGTRPVDLFLDGPAGARRRSRRRERLCRRQDEERPPRRQPLRLPEGVGRRHPRADDGGVARQGRDGAGERRARARDRQPRRMPQRHGRQDHRRRHLDHRPSRASSRCRARATASSRTASRPAPMPWPSP